MTQPLPTQEPQTQATVIPVAEGAEAFVELLNANQVDYIFLNPGTDTFPVQEAIAKFRYLGRRTPEVVLALHESVGMSAAHGHFMVSGHPQVVFVHVDLGTQQVGGALHNAQRGRAAVLLCAGRAPWTFDGELRGTKSSAIHWIQEQFDQAEVVRQYVKWDYELRRNENINHVVQRAFRVAASEPWGPVYLTLPREVLMEAIQQVSILPPARHGPAISPQADPEALGEAAAWLVQAERPLLITSYAGRHIEAVPALVELAELLAIPVVETRTRVNFPTDHPLYGGENPAPYLREADVVLVVDHDVPYIPALARPRPEAKIIHIDIDPVKASIPLWNFPVDLSIEANSARAIPALTEAARGRLTASDQSRIEARRQQLTERHRGQRRQGEQAALAKARERPIAPEWLAYCINQAVDEDALVLNESVTNSAHVSRMMQRTKPGTAFQSGGSSLGWGIGAALGAKLAAPERTVVALVGDGAFVFGCPTSALWAADVYKAPFLTVIFNNQRYHAPKASLQQGYGPDSYSERTGAWVGMDIAPPPDYALLAQACRAYGERVAEPDQVLPALRRGLERVRSGQAAVLDVLIQ